MLNIAVFASGRGSNFESLHRAILDQNIPARIVVVISNNSQAGALAIARSQNIPALHLSQKNFSDEEHYVQHLLRVLNSYAVNFIVLAGYMKKIHGEIISSFHNKIINIHPALLPKFGGAGMFGHHVHEAVIAAKEKKSGATVHIVDEEYDRGAIVLQDSVEVEEHDTPESLAAKVLKIEHVLLPKVVRLFAENKIIIENRIVRFI